MSESRFNFYTENRETNLYNGLNNELVSMYGIPCKYMVKTQVKNNNLLGDSIISSFTEENSFNVRLLPEDVTNLTGNDESYSKFGLNIENNIVFFAQYDTLIGAIGNIPIAGDLIYIEMMNRLFEVTKAERKDGAFFPLGKANSLKISCKLFNYSGEHLTEMFDDALTNLDGKTVLDEIMKDNGDNYLIVVSTLSGLQVGSTIAYNGITGTITSVENNSCYITKELGVSVGSTVTIGGTISATVINSYVTGDEVLSVISFDERSPW